jgi:hypothetical protein
MNMDKNVAINENTVLTKKREITIREEMEENGKYILFNAENELILVINSTGKFILDSCNGKKPVSQIIKDIEEQFTLGRDIDLFEVLKGYINTLLKAKLLKVNKEDC